MTKLGINFNFSEVLQNCCYLHYAAGINEGNIIYFTTKDIFAFESFVLISSKCFLNMAILHFLLESLHYQSNTCQSNKAN